MSDTGAEHRRNAVPALRGIGYGGDYNPEQWPQSVWREDVVLMAEAGVNLLTLGVFAWSRLQPRAGAFDPGWLDEVLALLDGAGIKVDLATATASPPPWLVARHPDMLPVTADGRLLGLGSRQHFCPSSQAYREAARELVGLLASRYAEHPALALWHVGNEFGCHVARCYCDTSVRAFRRWLEDRYHDIAALNEAWGGEVWSQLYSSFDEVGVPGSTPTFANPSQQLDFARFSSDELVACFESEREVLDRLSPGVPVTTNFVGFHPAVDQFRFAERLDVASTDSYPDPADPDSWLAAAFVCDLTRSVGRGKPWLLMEQAPSAVNWRTVNAAKAPGQYRSLSLQSVARGSDAVLSFQWRAASKGAEKFHSAMVPHAGTDTRVWREVVALGAELGRLAALRGTAVEADVAVVHSWPSWWALELDSHPSGRVRLRTVLEALYPPLVRSGLTCDLVEAEDELSSYRLVVVPALYLLTSAGAANVSRYVEQGGTALVSFFSGIVDEHDHVGVGGYPAMWTELLGLRVLEFAPLVDSEHEPLEGKLAPPGATGRIWRDDLALEGATALLSYASGYLEGVAAATEHAYGAGVACYLGTLPDPATTSSVTAHMLGRAGLRVEPLPAGVEALRRGRHLILLNHGTSPCVLDLDAEHHDLLSGRAVGPRLVLDSRDAVVLEPNGPVPAALR